MREALSPHPYHAEYLKAEAALTRLEARIAELTEFNRGLTRDFNAMLIAESKARARIAEVERELLATVPVIHREQVARRAAEARIAEAERERDDEIANRWKLEARIAEVERERRQVPSDEGGPGGPGYEEQYWLRAKLNASIRHLRDVEDFYRLREGLPEGFNMLRADRARSLYEQISDDFLNGNRDVPTMRDRAQAAEARNKELEEACLYLSGRDVGGWEGHMRDEEVLARVGLR